MEGCVCGSFRIHAEPEVTSMTRSVSLPGKFVPAALALAVVCALPGVASAAPGQLDTSFGHLGNGTVFADHGRGDFVDKVLRQPDGKIVTIAGALDDSGATSEVVTRYLANGSLDPSFGNGGVFSEDVLHSGFVTDGVLQPDGKIVIVGTAEQSLDFFVQRLRANGTVDPTFAPAPATTNFGGTKHTVDEPFTVALGPGGTIVLAGLSDDNAAIARYTSTGALDSTFSGDGLVTHDFGGGSEIEAIAVLGDGKIVVAGREEHAVGTVRNLVARFNANGSLDTTYGTGGRAAPTATPLESVDALYLQGTKAVVIGPAGIPTAALARFNANGTLDTTFGLAGKSLTQVGKFTRLTSLTADASGRLVAAGQVAYSDDFPDIPTFTSVFRYSANGVADPAFGCSGRVLTEVLGNGAGTSYERSGARSAATSGNDIVVAGFAVTFNQTDFPPNDDLVARYHGDGAHSSGYALLRGDGGTSAFGGAPACGSMFGLHLNQPIVGAAFDPVAPGDWTVASDGGIFSFGAAPFYGSMGGTKLNQPIVGMTAAPDGKGYWMVARDGGIFAFGSAKFFGSMGGTKLNQPVVGMAATRDGKGYWLVASDGGIFAFGSARFDGSMGGVRLVSPVVGIAADPDGRGYWMGAADGGVFSFAAKFSGSAGGFPKAQPVVGIAADPDGTGYWLAASDGGVFNYDAAFLGSNGSTPFPLGSPRATIAIAATP